ncbi:aquaporin-like protein [Aulographum hederae CBS 113979]|uniref:Aquaporin-like protein n=1 Tax=Aulographum hederae CBS 113979 TaxID=1176131 RepID=A0A6G1GR99_9PEZI|nr:aquaporin-like protein [Aulographum hederae CBS 113979]
MGTAAEKGPPPPRGVPGGLPWTMWMNSTAKNHFVATIGEIVGTTMFLFFAFAGTQVANVQDNPSDGTTTNASTGFSPIKLLYIAICFGFSLMVNVWVFFRISGGLFNPAVTLALLVTGAIGKIRALCLFIAQIIGAITASALVLGIFPAPLNAVQTTLSEGTSDARGLFIEAMLTAELVFTILMLAKEKHRSTFIAPVGIGLALFISELVGVYYTGGSLNPARSIGPAIVGNKWDNKHWIYWVGPFIGVVIAVAFYKFIKVLEYEMANPGQDADDWNDPTKNPNHELRERQRDMTQRVLRSLGLDGYLNNDNDYSPEAQHEALHHEREGMQVAPDTPVPPMSGGYDEIPNSGRSARFGPRSADVASEESVPAGRRSRAGTGKGPDPFDPVARMA